MGANANTPAVPCYIHNSYLLDAADPDYFGKTEAYLLSLRCLYGQAPQFTVVLDTGAIFTGLPTSAICFKRDTLPMKLSEVQLYDAIGSDIEIFVMETIRYAKCTVRLNDGRILNGKYLFTVDFVGTSILARDPYNWKQMHCIETVEGNFLMYPQYRVKILDTALAARCESAKLPKYVANENHWMVEQHESDDI